VLSLRRINDHRSFAYTARVSGSNSEDVYDPKVPPEKQKVTYQTKDGRIKTVTKAELQEQMEASEKLMQSLNETWEEKMQRTQEVQKEREKALEELGITVEKNLVGVHTPKKVRRFSAFPLVNTGSAYQLTASVIRCLIW
jgi:Kinesin-associated